jgi:glycosyltransferase involved in cell wall biosynthesis
MRVAIVTQALKREDGQGRVNYEIAHALLERGHRVLLCATEVAEDLRHHPNVAWHRVRANRALPYLIRDQLFAAASSLALARQRRAIDAIVVNGFVTWWPGELNLVHFVHSAWLNSAAHPRPSSLVGLYRWTYTALNVGLEKIGFVRAQTVVAVSELVKRQLTACGIDAGKIAVVANGVDLDQFKPGEGDRARFGLAPGRFTVLFAGDIRTARKNLGCVLAALAAVPDIHLAVAGASGGSPFIQKARELGLAERVHFLDLRRDLADLMRSVDAFVLPSRFEPFGLVLLEASACGLPVIASRDCGAVEAMAGDGMIVLSDADDVRGLAAAFQRLSSDRELCARMGRAGRAAAERLSWRAAAEQHVRLIEKVGRRDEVPA